MTAPGRSGATAQRVSDIIEAASSARWSLPPAKPIPALYTVYMLQSTQRRASYYVGSTPNPPRRLRQHNGDVKGGAQRTARESLRPWQMVGLLSGFPSMTAALRFEWALEHPHLTRHITSADRAERGPGRGRKPLKSVSSLIANVQLLLRAPSFSRWPLRVHFFCRAMHARWVRATYALPATERARPTIPVVEDFGPDETAAAADAPAWGIHALPLDYAPLRAHATKAHGLLAADGRASCCVCREPVAAGRGLWAVCPAGGCDAVGHVTCWSGHMLAVEGAPDAVLPVAGPCPSCGGPVQWGELVKELSVRVRAPKLALRLVQGRTRAKKTARADERADTCVEAGDAVR